MSACVFLSARCDVTTATEDGDDIWAVFLAALPGSPTADPETTAARWLNDPLGFAENAISWPVGRGLTDYQREILAAIPDQRRVSVRGPHGLGKTALAAITVLWFALSRDAAGRDWKVVTTAGAWRQLTKYLWPEIKKWARALRWEAIGRGPFNERTELLSLTIKLRTGEAFPVASDNPDLIEGAHADDILYIFDESKAISATTFDAAEGAFSGGGVDHRTEAYALALSTPGAPAGRFYDIHRRAPGLEDWWVRHVTLDEAIAAGRVSRDWAVQRRTQWGNSAVYHNRVLGEFHSSDHDGVVPLEWVAAANARWQAWRDAGAAIPDGLRVLGVDIARSGEDKTVVAIRHGLTIAELRHTAHEDTMATTGRIKGIIDSFGADGETHTVVDVIGIGAGVVDRLREMGHRTIGFNAAARTKRKDGSGELGFINCRAAAWWGTRELLDPANGHDVALPPVDLLTGDLTAPRWKVVSGGLIQIESKDDIRKRTGRSTDDGDAVVMAFWLRSPGWLDAYGVRRCQHCQHPYMAALHPDRCPACRREQDLAD